MHNLNRKSRNICNICAKISVPGAGGGAAGDTAGAKAGGGKAGWA